MADLSRRMLLRGLCGCTLSAPWAAALARVSPLRMTPLVTPDYEPIDDDERGLWHLSGRFEEELSASDLLVKDLALTQYLHSVLARMLGDSAARLRVYPVHSPDFNATMTPGGAMIINTGLLVRVRNEAQLAAVLGHECGHYLRRHAIRNWRDRKARTALDAITYLGSEAAVGTSHGNWYHLAHALSFGFYVSMSSFSKSMEREADAYGVKLLDAGGYPPEAAGQVWMQWIAERQASAAVRGKHYQDRSGGLFSTHPPTRERLRDVAISASELTRRSAPKPQYDDRRAQFAQAIAALRPRLIEEQVMVNDAGASLYLLNSLAQDGWDGVLRYYEGEAFRLRDEHGDRKRAAAAYAAAVQFEDAPPEAHRAHGYAQVQAGAFEEGRSALARYLELRPDAPDAAMVRFTLGLPSHTGN